MHRQQTASPSRAFTLIELLVVISIISMLIAILLPALAKARDASKAIKCAAQEKQIALALNVYGQDNDNMILHYNMGPDNAGGIWDWSEYLDYTHYLDADTGIWNCPSAQSRTFRSYAMNWYIAGSAKLSPTKWNRFEDVLRSSQVILFADMKENAGVTPLSGISDSVQLARIATRHEDANFTFVDGHVQRLPLPLPKYNFDPNE